MISAFDGMKSEVIGNIDMELEIGLYIFSAPF